MYQWGPDGGLNARIRLLLRNLSRIRNVWSGSILIICNYLELFARAKSVKIRRGFWVIYYNCAHNYQPLTDIFKLLDYKNG